MSLSKRKTGHPQQCSTWNTTANCWLTHYPNSRGKLGLLVNVAQAGGEFAVPAIATRRSATLGEKSVERSTWNTNANSGATFRPRYIQTMGNRLNVPRGTLLPLPPAGHS